MTATPRVLRAGPLVVQLEDGELRYALAGNGELLRRVYVAVRDEVWNTIPGQVEFLGLDADDESFHAAFRSRHVDGELDFEWHGEIHGRSDGMIEYSLRGRAARSFRYARIGINVLHPPNFAGRLYRARTSSGPVHGSLPALIGPQPCVDGEYLSLFPPFSSLELECGPRQAMSFEFQGALFEMEDQRNWSDASFKTFPAAPGEGLLTARAGEELEQRLIVRPPANLLHASPEPEAQITLSLVPESRRAGPSLGLGRATHGEPGASRPWELLRALSPDHLRCDLLVDEGDRFAADLDVALAEASRLGCELELALTLTETASAGLSRFAAALPVGAPVARVLVFGAGLLTTPEGAVELVRERLACSLPGVPIAGGTDGFFAEINRDRPDPAPLDGLTFSVNPQVHAFDETSLVETLPIQGDAVRSASTFADGRPIVVSPITLKPRFDPYSGHVPSAGHSPETDVRQPTLFAAAWTLISFKHIAYAGAAAVTYYETTGPRGVVDPTTGDPFPIYHVLADAKELAGGELIDVTSSSPLLADAVAARVGDRLVLCLANLSTEPRTVCVEVGGRDAGRVRRLDASTMAAAARDPEGFRRSFVALPVHDGSARIELGAFATARVELPFRSAPLARAAP